MSSSYPSPPSTPLPVTRGAQKDLAPQNEGFPTTPTAPLRNSSDTAIKAKTVANQIDTMTLKTRLGLKNGKCGSPTKHKGHPACKNPNPSDIEYQIRSMANLTQTSRQLLDQLEILAGLALCQYHIKPGPKANRIKVWREAFPVGDERAGSIESIKDQITTVLDCFPYTNKYTCIGTNSKGKPCEYAIGGKKVLQGKKALALVIEQEHSSRDDSLIALLEALALNTFCHHHTEQIAERVATWTSSISAIYKAYPLNTRPSSQTSNFRLSHGLDAGQSDFWDDKDDTSAFVTEIEEDRPSNGLACYALVQEKMKEPLKKPELDNGYVYVYEVEGNKGFVKIGFTTKSLEERSAEWKFQCDRLPKILYPVEPRKKIPHANRVEGLCLAELKHRSVTIICEACPRRHIEWVQAPATEVVLVIQKWTKWIETKPFLNSKRRLPNGKLATFWVLRDREKKRTDDMSKFMMDIAAASSTRQEPEPTNEIPVSMPIRNHKPKRNSMLPNS